MNERGDKLRLLYPLVDVATTLDPRFVPPYRFGGYFVHDYVDPELGFRLLDKGIANNPGNWFLYQDKALLLWSSGDCAEAARVFDAAAGLPNAPSGAAALGPSVLAGCGDIDAAAATYARLEQEFADDPMLRDFVRRKRAGLDAQSEVEALNAGVETFRAASGAYPPALPVMLRSGALPRGARIRVDAHARPVDPLGVPYAYDPQTGRITPGENGAILPARLFQKRDEGSVARPGPAPPSAAGAPPAAR